MKATWDDNAGLFDVRMTIPGLTMEQHRYLWDLRALCGDDEVRLWVAEKVREALNIAIAAEQQQIKAWLARHRLEDPELDEAMTACGL